MGLFYVHTNSGAEISWVRLGVAVGFLVLLVLGSYFTAGDDSLAKLHESLTNPIESVMGLIFGLIAGESLATR